MKGTYKQIRQLFPATGYRAFCGTASMTAPLVTKKFLLIGRAVVRHSLLADIGDFVAHCVELCAGSRDSVDIMVDQDGPSDISDANDYTYSNSFCVVVRPTEQLDTADLGKENARAHGMGRQDQRQEPSHPGTRRTAQESHLYREGNRGACGNRAPRARRNSARKNS